MDNTLNDFLEEVGVGDNRAGSSPHPRKTHKKGKKVEGVWVVNRGGPRANVGDGADQNRSERDEVAEELDEMIWWSWDGKIVGFSDW